MPPFFRLVDGSRQSGRRRRRRQWKGRRLKPAGFPFLSSFFFYSSLCLSVSLSVSLVLFCRIFIVCINFFVVVKMYFIPRRRMEGKLLAAVLNVLSPFSCCAISLGAYRVRACKTAQLKDLPPRSLLLIFIFIFICISAFICISVYIYLYIFLYMAEIVSIAKYGIKLQCKIRISRRK